MKASEKALIEKIIIALNSLGNLKMISYEEEINWLRDLPQCFDADKHEKIRIQAAIAAMQGMIASEFYCTNKTRNDSVYSKYREKWRAGEIAREAVAHADALIEELNKPMLSKEESNED